MKKNWVLGICLVILLAGAGFFMLNRTGTISINTDELAGTWSAQAPADAEYQWFVTYAFDGKGAYTMRTDSTYQEDGSYEITQGRDDDTRLVHKRYGTPEDPKEYEMEVVVDGKTKTISIDGMVLTKVE